MWFMRLQKEGDTDQHQCLSVQHRQRMRLRFLYSASSSYICHETLWSDSICLAHICIITYMNKNMCHNIYVHICVMKYVMRLFLSYIYVHMCGITYVMRLCMPFSYTCHNTLSYVWQRKHLRFLDWVMLHMWMSHAAHVKKSCDTNESVMSHMWMS